MQTTVSAPHASQASILCAAPTTPTTGAQPSVFAICTSMDPTPPAAECTSTARFRVGGAAGQNCASAIACNAVPATDGSAAASAAESALGVLRHWLAGTSSRDE